MSRETAYRLRRRTSGRAFALAWDAALLLARQRMIDDVIDMAFDGSIERHFRDGKLVLEKRRRDPRALLTTIERLGSNKALGTPPAKAVAEDFEEFLDCMEDDYQHRRGEAAEFMQIRADSGNMITKPSLVSAQFQLREALDALRRGG